jgi:hypothetical protein
MYLTGWWFSGMKRQWEAIDSKELENIRIIECKTVAGCRDVPEIVGE